jgi:signal peptidase
MARTLMRATVRAVVALLLLTCVGVAVAMATGQLRTVTLLTGSMSPRLPAGTFLLERPVAAHDVRVGDVITFHKPSSGELVTHRITATTTKAGKVLATTKGDGNDQADAWQVVLTGGPVWRVSGHVPGVGHAANALQHHRMPLVWAGLVFPVLLLGTFLQALWRPEAEPQAVPA